MSFDIKKFITENVSTQHNKILNRFCEAKDETDVQKKKGRVPRNWQGHGQIQWESRIHSKGSYWQVGQSGQWGARAKSGQVDHFSDKSVAIQFADYTYSGPVSSYVSGQFAKRGK